jgi:hypothetical protein
MNVAKINEIKILTMVLSLRKEIYGIPIQNFDG